MGICVHMPMQMPAVTTLKRPAPSLVPPTLVDLPAPPASGQACRLQCPQRLLPCQDRRRYVLWQRRTWVSQPVHGRDSKLSRGGFRILKFGSTTIRMNPRSLIP
eukprot:2682447-Prymnesium_polylepis.1